MKGRAFPEEAGGLGVDADERLPGHEGVPENGAGELLDVVGHDERAPLGRSADLSTQEQGDGGPGRRTELDRRVVPGAAHDLRDVAEELRVDAVLVIQALELRAHINLGGLAQNRGEPERATAG